MVCVTVAGALLATFTGALPRVSATDPQRGARRTSGVRNITFAPAQAHNRVI